MLTMRPAPIIPCVLVVDDDPVWLLVCSKVLKKAGYEVVTAPSAKRARALLEERGFERFSAVFSDLRMPGEDGISLITFIHTEDDTLSTLLMTAEGDKTLVTRALREGARNFADKPIPSESLVEFAERAVNQTQASRQLRFDASSTRSLGESQECLLTWSTRGLRDRLKIYFRPLEKAGGDFVSVFEVSSGRFIVLVSDISGHDLRTALHSSYYQGLARGMVDSGQDLEATFERINALLCAEGQAKDEVKVSIAACGLDVDLETGEVRIVNCGLPTPFVCDTLGLASMCNDVGSSPLGWFENTAPAICRAGNGRVLFWSDGLEDLALALGISALSLAHRLVRASTDDALLREASDDILVGDLNLFPNPDQPVLSPLLSECYGPEDVCRIDEIQAYFERSLSVALPDLNEEKLIGCLIGVREGLLNALLHGCKGVTGERVTVQVSYAPQSQSLNVEINDPGEGHCFDLNLHEQRAADDLLEKHRGLILMKNLSSRMQIADGCGRVVMEFETA